MIQPRPRERSGTRKSLRYQTTPPRMLAVEGSPAFQACGTFTRLQEPLEPLR